MPSAKELRDELRALRKESAKPISKMRVSDIASEIERLKNKREDTPLPAATPAEKTPKKMSAKIPDLKESKAKEFPVKPSAVSEKKEKVVVGGSGAVGETTKLKSSKKDKLAKLLALMESDSE